MKSSHPSLKFLTPLLMAGIAVGGLKNAQALVWAGPSGTTTAPTSGTWTTAAGNVWAATSGAGTSAWVNASQADLGGATSAVSLTLGTAGMSVVNLNFNSSNYTINAATANTLSMTGTLSLAGSSSAAIGNHVSLTRTGNGTYTFISGNTGTLNINSGSLVDTAGTGTHSITGAGVVINVDGELAGASGTDGSTNLFVLGSTTGDNVTVNVDNGGLFSVGGRSLRIANGANTAATVNVVNGATLQMTGVQTGTAEVGHIYVGFGASATGTLNVSGGSVTTGTSAGGGELVVAGGTSTGIVSISGGTVTSTARMAVGELGNATVTLSGSGSLNVGASSTGVNFGSGLTSTGTSVFNLDGGTLSAPAITNLSSGSTDTFNFNGGTLKANASNASFTGTNAYSAKIKEGGAIIDTNTFNITYGQVLAHGGVAATDGGLTKNGSGTLTLSAANTFTGVTKVNAGTLALSNTSALQSSELDVTGAGAVTLASGTNTLGGFKNASGVAGTTLNASTNSITLAGTSDITVSGTSDFTAVNVTNATAFTLGGTLNLTLSTTFTPGAYSFNLIDGNTAGTFTTVNIGGNYSATLNSGNGWLQTVGNNTFGFDNVNGVLSITAVPEPASVSLAVALGVVSIVIGRQARLRGSRKI